MQTSMGFIQINNYDISLFKDTITGLTTFSIYKNGSLVNDGQDYTNVSDMISVAMDICLNSNEEHGKRVGIKQAFFIVSHKLSEAVRKECLSSYYFNMNT